ncbi:hypothetical protein OSB04_008475 [Centaurea solstitialis]|uniref:Uncharacterized protein n=1 Tax=Centaurea solstitialis TaxID=347529 RepID=A0AA38WRF9_9ASTR|nr:hypothetical protein OSB04_008475 [Centaurea solstitialis]
MKLVWSPEMALEAFIETVKTCKNIQESDDAEMISAMVGGWKPRLIVEAWASGGEITTSIGLEIAARHLGARHVCIVENENSRSEYVAAMINHGSQVPELVMEEAKEAMATLQEVEFMVVDGRCKDLYKLFGFIELSHRGAVLVCKNTMQRYTVGFHWDFLIGEKARVTKSTIIPVGQGLNIAYVKKNLKSRKSTSKYCSSRWITRIDEKTGEEHIFRG